MVKVLPLVAAFGMTMLTSPAFADCSTVMPAPGPIASGPKRDVTARDLVELRFIGEPSFAHVFGASPLGISPDGTSIAFVLSKPDVVTNQTCQALVILDTATGAIRSIDTGGERIPETYSWRGVRITDGWPAIITPRWSADGRYVGYLKRLGGVDQLWVARADGSGAQRMSDQTAAVEDWRWADAGQSLLYTTRLGAVAASEAIDREGRTGWLFDERVWPNWGPRPQTPADTKLDIVAVDLAGVRRPASTDEARGFIPLGIPGEAQDQSVVSRSGQRAFTHLDPGRETGPRRLKIRSSSGAIISSPDTACRDGILQMWWDRDALVYLHREGWANETTALYRWAPGAGVPRRVFATSDALVGCDLRSASLLCADEASSIPRRIVRFDTKTGRKTVLFDPNPEFAKLRLGRVERLRITNANGLPSWADLVLPPGYKPGTRLPTIVVQYRSRGFLLGGSGDDYPIFLFAAHGFAVLSIERPSAFGSNDPALKTIEQVIAAGLADWSERRSLLSSVTVSIDKAVAMGVTDPSKVGITGLSDGATTTQFAMINSQAFAAAAISSGILEPNMVMTDGISWADQNRARGYPSLTKPDDAFWKAISFTFNAGRINTPLLMQMPDREYTEGIQGFMALREAGKPVEMYVFPDEYHTKQYPVHRLAIYQRSLDWFDFWLRGVEDPALAKAPQYRRWRAFRASPKAN